MAPKGAEAQRLGAFILVDAFDTCRDLPTLAIDTSPPLRASTIRKPLVLLRLELRTWRAPSGISVASTKSDHAMLKITMIDDDHRRTLILEGQLMDPWISELERSWTEAQLSIGGRSAVVDLKDVTAISQHGENVLYRMIADGAELNCCRGVFTKHVLRQLKHRCKAQSRKACVNK
jgi:hypothetical protein